MTGPHETEALKALMRMAAYDAVQPQVWISRLAPDHVLEQAQKVDDRIDAGEVLPLAGLTFAVKDNIDVAGLPTTAACPAFAYTPDRSATVVERLMAAGAVLVGKTNLDQFATGLVGARSPYGAPRSVFNLDYISGGSSSGSAVAVAAGLVDFALGTDTAGSGRVPAAFNNLVGYKPTRGRWSTRGVVPACRSLDCVSVLSKDAGLAARVDAVLKHFDAEDPFSRRCRPAEWDIQTIAVPRPEQLNWLGDHQSERLFGLARERLASMGCSFVEVDIAPLTDAAKLLYQGPWVAERTAAVLPLLDSDPGAFHPVVREIIEGGRSFSAVEAFDGYYKLKALKRESEGLWRGADALLLPTTATTYRLREIEAAPIALNGLLGLYTNFVNLLDMSAIAVPAGFRDNATGFGVTLIGPAWADAALLSFAQRYQEIAPMPPAPDLDTGGRAETIKLAVVGAHLEGMPLHWQLTSRDAKLVAKTTTAPVYRLYAMANTTPPKPALIHMGDGKGAAIALEVYELDAAAFGSFVSEVPPPLAIGTVTLADGAMVKGFVAEPRAMEGAEDITALGGWRAYIARG
jgi:allophanate hydrolase